MVTLKVHEIIMSKVRHDIRKVLFLCAFLMSSTSALAIPIYVGSFDVFDGPAAWTEPEVMSAREVAAMLFGGEYNDYAISVLDSTDWQTITHTAWVDGLFDDQFLFNPVHEDYSVAPASGLYNDYPAYSAWVCDHADCVGFGYPENAGWEDYSYTNYVWRLDSPPVDMPEPGMLGLFALGLTVLGISSRRRSN
ncbi:MAG: PEP-CTERM sorting domain-containing protein [Candidatus Accumulibacter sp.]|jgi:hypothetical protein|nr:PEP-CTERM sorting domain-containing protein [Accumulibacter sp.]